MNNKEVRESFVMEPRVKPQMWRVLWGLPWQKNLSCGPIVGKTLVAIPGSVARRVLLGHRPSTGSPGALRRALHKLHWRLSPASSRDP